MDLRHLRKLAEHWRNSTRASRRQRSLEWVGFSPYCWWAAHFDSRPQWLSGLPKCGQNREQLVGYLAQETEPQRAIASVLAWGKMDRRNAPRFASKFDECANCVTGFSSKSRHECYEALHQKFDGLGPAFATKLIRYLRPDANDVGFIMDQWLAKSVNLVSGHRQPRIKMYGENRNYVDRANTAQTYGWFCAQVEAIAAEVDALPSELEEFMFASTDWKKYVERR